LLAAGWLVRERDGQGRDTVCVTDSGVALLAQTLQRNRAAHDAHEALVARVAREMQRAGRLVWRGLCLRAQIDAPPLAVPTARAAAMPSAGQAAALPAEPPAAKLAGHTIALPWPASADAAGAGAPVDTAAAAWVMAMPDVYSIRHTSVERYLAPVAHEVKVRRADLLSDLRRPAKGAAYRWLASECWYVIAEGIAQPEEIPAVYGVLVAPPSGALQVARPAPQRAMSMPFAVWMALARATPEPTHDDGQRTLGEPAD